MPDLKISAAASKIAATQSARTPAAAEEEAAATDPAGFAALLFARVEAAGDPGLGTSAGLPGSSAGSKRDKQATGPSDGAAAAAVAMLNLPAAPLKDPATSPAPGTALATSSTAAGALLAAGAPATLSVETDPDARSPLKAATAAEAPAGPSTAQAPANPVDVRAAPATTTRSALSSASAGDHRPESPAVPPAPGTGFAALQSAALQAAAPAGSAAPKTAARAAAVVSDPVPVIAGPVAGPVAQSPASIQIATPVTSPQWTHEFATTLAVNLRNGLQSAQIHIEPRDLGPISVSVTMSGTSAAVSMVAAHSDTRALLQSSLGELRDVLSAAGIQLSGAFVQTGGSERQGQSGSYATPEQFAGTAIPPPVAAAGPASAAAGLQSAGPGRRLVDTFA
jgi:flagellar hook-length control protein FliK